MSTPLPSDPAVAAFGASLTAITLAELGDKTFFMALILAARHYLLRHPDPPPCRFDVLLFDGALHEAEPTWLRAAFDAS